LRSDGPSPPATDVKVSMVMLLLPVQSVDEA